MIAKDKDLTTFSGIVIHGKKLGRTIGYPTANIELVPWVVADGVYALSVDYADKIYQGVGTYREEISLFEAHLFDYSGDLYDKTLNITIIGKIRDNQQFDSLDALRSQIQKDSNTAKTFAF